MTQRSQPSARVRSRAAAHAIPMVVQPDPLQGSDPYLNLLGGGPEFGGQWAIRVPLAAFPMADFAPGSLVTVILGIQQTHMEADEDASPSIILPPGLDLNG